MVRLKTLCGEGDLDLNLEGGVGVRNSNSGRNNIGKEAHWCETLDMCVFDAGDA